MKRPPKPDNSRTAVAIKKTTALQQTWSGPVPSPDAVDGYEKIMPGAAKIIFDMACSQHNHRIALEKSALAHRQFMEKSGLMLGSLLCVSGMVGGCLLAYSGKDLTGFGVFFVSLSGLIASSIYKKNQTK